MKVISCAGYYATGSSAVTDFFSEFDNIKSLGETEFKFLQDCDGVSALEMNLIEHPHRHNTCHAIKRFIKASKFENGNILSKRYRKFFGDKYMEYTWQYINEITELKTNNHWRGDCIERGELFYMLDALLSVISSKICKGKFSTSILSLTNEKAYYSSIDRDAFYAATKRYTSRLFSSVGEGMDYIMVDQLTPPSEPNRYMNYVDDLYVVVVDRDPRDVYLQTLIHRPHFKQIPLKVEDFCEWYRILRRHRDKESECSKAILINLEDLIYKYQETSSKLMSFIGVSSDHHIHPLEWFNPRVSINGTQLWKKDNTYDREVEYIAQKLPEYLYNYK